jgi:hypothetical protein
MAKPLSISLKGKVNPIITFGFILQAVVTFLGVIALLILGFTEITEIPLLSLLVISGAVFFSFISKKYFERIFSSEKIIVTYSTLTVIHKTLSKEIKNEFPLRDVLYLGFAGNTLYTENNMGNSVIDFTGLATVEKEVQFLIDEGTIELETEHQVFRFGKNMASWDTEELIKKIEDHLGRKFINKYTAVLYD